MLLVPLLPLGAREIMADAFETRICAVIPVYLRAAHVCW